MGIVRLTSEQRKINKARASREWYLRNKKSSIERATKYNKDHPEKRKETNEKYRQRNIEKIKTYRRNRLKNDINFKLKYLLSSRIRYAMKGGKNFRSQNYLGCTLEEVRKYIESKFKKGMSWKNHGFEGWHIDHIKPLSLFDFTKEEDRLKAFHYTNLQPLWAKENFLKGNKYEENVRKTKN